MATGTVKWFNPSKGYGFIEPEGGGDDVFVHMSAVTQSGLQTLPDAQRVTFDIVNDEARGRTFASKIELI